MLSPQEVVEALQPRARVGQLEQLLLRRKGKRKEFGETGAHPGAGIEPVRRLEEPLALLRDHALEQAHAGLALFRHRSEEHTSELQSRLHLVCRLLLEKKKKKKRSTHVI